MSKAREKEREGGRKGERAQEVQAVREQDKSADSGFF